MAYKILNKQGITAQMAPVPRKLSSSCGTCVFYSSSDPHLEVMGEEVEGVYQAVGKEYEKLLENA